MNYIETSTTATLGTNQWQFHNIQVEEDRFPEVRDALNQAQVISEGIAAGWIIDLGTSTITFED